MGAIEGILELSMIIAKTRLPILRTILIRLTRGAFDANDSSDDAISITRRQPATNLSFHQPLELVDGLLVGVVDIEHLGQLGDLEHLVNLRVDARQLERPILLLNPLVEVDQHAQGR